MTKEEYLIKLKELDKSKEDLYTKYLADFNSGNTRLARKNLKDSLFENKVQRDLLKMQFTNSASNYLKDSLSEFIKGNITLSGKLSTSKTDVFEAYSLYCLEHGLRIELKYQTFCRKFVECFPNDNVSIGKVTQYINGKPKRVHAFKGVALKFQ